MDIQAENLGLAALSGCQPQEPGGFSLCRNGCILRPQCPFLAQCQTTEKPLPMASGMAISGRNEGGRRGRNERDGGDPMTVSASKSITLDEFDRLLVLEEIELKLTVNQVFGWLKMER